MFSGTDHHRKVETVSPSVLDLSLNILEGRRSISSSTSSSQSTKSFSFCSPPVLGCARFPEFTQNFSERQILWSLCSVDFHTLTLQLPIQTPYSVAPELQVFVSSLENCPNFKKTSTPPKCP